MTPSRTIGQACHALHPIGNAILDTFTILDEIRDELPKRGHLTDLYIELIETLERLETTYRNAEEALLQAYRELENTEQAAHQGWTPQPFNTNGRA